MPERNLRQVGLDGLRLLSRRQRRCVIILGGLVALVELLQVAAVILVLPVIGVMVEPTLVEGSALVGWLHRGLGSPPVGQFILLLGVGALVLNTAGQVSQFLVHSAIEVFTARTQTGFARNLLAEVVEAPYPWFLDRNSATLVRLFHNDIALWGRDFVGNMLRILSHGLTIGAGVLVVLVAAPLQGVGLLALVAGIAYGVVRALRPHLVWWTNLKRQAADATMVMETQVFSGVKDIKVNGSQGYFVEAFGSLYGLMSRASARGVILSVFPTSALLLVGQAGLVLVTLVLWQTGSRGGALASQLALIALVTHRVVPAVTRLSAAITQLVNVMPWVRGILDLRDSVAEAHRALAEPRGTRPVPVDWTQIHFMEVSFQYGGNGPPILSDLSVTLERGRSYGLIGSSGAGKSTFVDLLLGLLRPCAGQIGIDAAPLEEIDPRDWHRRVGYVPQTPYFTDDTILNNIAFGVSAPAIEADRVRWCVTMVGLEELVAALPRGLDTSLGDRALRISGGQRQRIAIARALYRQPDILILDEATSALDPASQQVVMRAIEGLRGHVTTLIISHRMTAVAACERILLLDRGRLVATGTFDDVVLTHPSFGEAVVQRGSEVG